MVGTNQGANMSLSQGANGDSRPRAGSLLCAFFFFAKIVMKLSCYKPISTSTMMCKNMRDGAFPPQRIKLFNFLV